MIVTISPIRFALALRGTHKRTVEVLPGGDVQLTFDAPQRAVTPGQAAVIYDGDTVLGGGRIV